MSDKARSFKDLLVWQKAHEFVLEVYKLTKGFPKEEIYCLTQQLRRAAISVPANNVEGFGRKGIKEKLRFYSIAKGSLNEVGYFLLLSNELNYSDNHILIEKVEEIGKMLNSYIKTMQE
jgi:four helix bundle protein